MALASATNHLTTRGNTPLVFRPSLLTAGKASTILSLDSGTNGTVSLDGNGDIIFMPEADFSGAATFDVTVVNANGQTSTSTITVDVAPIEQASIERSGAEFLVNTTTAGGQFESSIAVLANGNFVITWTDTSNGSSVRAQIVDHNGSTIGSEFVVNTTTRTNQHAPQTSALANGNFVVTWEDDAHSGDVRAQIFNPSGHKVGAEFVVNTTTTGAQDTPSITALANGGFVVTWHDKTSTSGDIKAQIFGAGGSKAGSEFVVNTTTKSTQTTPSITALADGGFVVTWVDSSHVAGDKSGSAVSGQIFAADGSKTGGEFLVNAITNSDQNAPTITALTGGGFVVAWEDFSGQVGDNDSSGIVAQIFNDQGQKVGDQFLVNTTTTGPQLAPRITALADGKFVVVWDSYNNPTPDSQGAPTLLGQALDAGGNKVGHEFQINSQPENDRTFPSIAALPDGRFVVSWTDSSGQGPDTDGFGVKAQIFTVTTTGADQAPMDETLTLDQTLINNGGKLSENSGFGTKVGVVRGIDPDIGDGLTYSLVNLDSKGQPIANGGAFAIDAKSGEVTVASKAALDFESATSHDVKVTVTDRAGLSFVKTLKINLSDVNEAPIDATLIGGGVPENSANGTVVGTISGTDPDVGDVLSYALLDAAGGRFAIDAHTGLITVANGALLDFESNASHNVTVRVMDHDGLFIDKTFTIVVANVNEAPTDAKLLSADGQEIANPDGTEKIGLGIQENSPSGAVVGTVAGVDPDVGTVFTYSLTDNAGGRFTIDARTGVVTVATDLVGGHASLDFEQSKTHKITVQVTDQGGLSTTKTFTINVLDVNEGPTDELLSNNLVAVDASGGTVIGTVQAIDPDAGEFFTYSLVDSAGNPVTGGPFAIDPGTGELSVADSSQLNTSSALSVTVRVTDKALLTFDKTFAVHVQPKAVADHFAVDEHKVLVIPAASIIDNDLDPSHQAVVSAVGNASNGTVSLVNGVVTFTPNPNFSGVAHFDYTISNPQGETSTATETVDVAPVSDAPTLAAQATVTRAPEVSGGPVFGVSVFAAISVFANGGFVTAAFDQSTGRITAQIFDSSNNLVRSETVQANPDSNSGNAREVFLAPLSNGRFALTWAKEQFDAARDSAIFTQIFDAGGNTIGPVITASFLSVPDPRLVTFEGAIAFAHRALSQGPDVVPLADGGFIMAYDQQHGIGFNAQGFPINEFRVAAQRFDSNGNKVGSEFRVDDGDDTQTNNVLSSVTALANGGFAVLWSDVPSRSGGIPSRGLVASIFDSHGGLVRTDLVVAPVGSASLSAGLTNGGFVVAGYEGGLLHARLFDSVGNAVNIEIVINSAQTPTNDDGLPQPFVAALTDGKFVLAWVDRGTDSAGHTIFSNKAQVYDATGHTVGGVLSLGAPGTAFGSARYPGITGLPNGDFVVNWQDNTGHANAQVFSVGGGTDVNMPIRLNVAAALTDTDSSESLTLTVDNIPVGATLTDGTHSFTAAAGHTIADISKWNFGNLTITPLQNFLGDIQLALTADSTNTATLSADTTSNSTAVKKTVVIEIGDESLTNNTVDENVTTGPIVGTITGHHAAAGDTLNYAMLDDAGGRFAVDNHGVVTVKGFLGPDAANSYDITVRTTETSPAGQTSFDTVFIIEVIHANRAPDRATLKMPNHGVLPHATEGTLVGTVTGQDPDGDHPLLYTLVNSANGAFEIDRVTGDITVRDASKLDGSKDILVRVTDPHGAFSDLSFTIPVTPDHAPTDVTLQRGGVASFAKQGDVVGMLVGSDPDHGDTLSYSLVGDASGLFGVDQVSGAIFLTKNLDLSDFNNRASYEITVSVIDAAGTAFTKTVTLPTAHTAPPTSATLSASTVPELVAGRHLPTGFEVGTVTGILRDQDVAAGDSVGNYHFVDPESGNLTTALDGFFIDSDTGVITVINPQLLDFQNVGEQDLDVWMTDRAGFVFIKTFTITLAGVAGPTDATLAGGEVPADAHNGTVVGTVNPIESAQDTLEGDRVIYALTDSAEGRFAIDPTLGDISVANIDIFDFKTSYNVTVLMTDRVGNTFSKTFAIAPPSLHSDLSGVPSAHVTNGNMDNNTLAGGVGKDILTGNGGNDILGRGGGQDRIVKGVAANTAASGELDFGAKVSVDQLWFKQSGNDLSVSILGSQDRITVADRFDSSAAQLAEIKTADGLEIDCGLSKLVQGMASYSAAHTGFDQTTMPQAPNDGSLQNTIAAAWHH